MTKSPIDISSDNTPIKKKDGCCGDGSCGKGQCACENERKAGGCCGTSSSCCAKPCCKKMLCLVALLLVLAGAFYAGRVTAPHTPETVPVVETK